MKQDILAVVGAGEAAIPIINKAKSMGIKTIVFGQNGSLAQNISDVFIDNDIFDIEGVYCACKKNNVNGVIASSEISTEVAAIVAQKLGLPGNDVSKGFAGRNKYEMRCRVKEIDSVSQPFFELYVKNKEYKLPVVVKAVDSCGKQGISLVTKKEEMHDAIEYARKYSSDGSALIEEYLEGGEEYSIECIAFGEKCWVIQYTQKITAGAPHFVEIAHHQPADLDSETKRKIDVAAHDILNVLGITCGMAHLEIKIINNKIYFIEVGARAGGGHIADTLLPLSTDFDYFKAGIECSLGKYQYKEGHHNSYSGIFFYCKQMEEYMPLFKESKTATWCFTNTIESCALKTVKCSAEKTEYVIYSSDKKITIDNYMSAEGCAIEINAFHNAYQMIWDHCKEIGRDLSDYDLDKGIKKFLSNGHVIAIVRDNHILAFLNLYCNNFDTLEAYICNVYVLEKYRGKGFSKKLMDKALSICRNQNFKYVSLHVENKNSVAVDLYKKYGFVRTGNTKEDENHVSVEMKLTL